MKIIFFIDRTNSAFQQEEKIKSQERKLFRLESLVQDLIDNQ